MRTGRFRLPRYGARGAHHHLTGNTSVLAGQVQLSPT
jgi:hypothetical protein